MTAADVLRAVELTRPSVSSASAEQFAGEAARFARL